MLALWQRYQDLYYHEGLEFYLMCRMRFDDAFVEALQPKFEQAFQDMAALKEANPDENCMVGHYCTPTYTNPRTETRYC